MFNKMSFQHKIFTYYSIFIVVVLLLLVFVFYSYMSSLLQDKEIKSMEQSVEKISLGLDLMLKEIDTVSTQVLFSKDIQEIMSDALEFQQEGLNFYHYSIASAKKAQNVLMSINSIKSTVERICIFNEMGSYITAGKVVEDRIPKEKFSRNAPWHDDIEKTYDRSTILPPHKDEFLKADSSPLVLSFIREMFATYGAFNHIGYVEVQQPYSMIESICSTNKKSISTVIVIDEKGNIIYPVNKYSKSEVIYYNSLKESSGKMVNHPIDNTQYLVYAKHLSYANWMVIIAQQKKDFMAPVYFLQNILLSIGFIFITFTLFIMYFITKSLTAPIRELRRHVENLSLDNLSINLSSRVGNNEVALLNEAFNKTLDKLKESMEQIIQARSGETHAHLLALQAQMNPHFLYNTLMGISGLANEAGNYKVVTMCSQLSCMLRYVASFSNTNVTLIDELKHAENYLKLNKWRFEDLLEYELNTDENLYTIKVPKLIIQPLVENCFVHGFKNQAPPFKISIKGHVENNRWVVGITDNGCGFDRDTIDRIFRQVQQYKMDTRTGKIFNNLEIGGMGMLNIYMRLRLLYGGDTVFNITNSSEGGATITIGGTNNY